MSRKRHRREEVYNSELVALLAERLPGWDLAAEVGGMLLDADRTPDLMVTSPNGFPVVVEAKYEKSGLLKKVEEQAAGSVGLRTDKGAIVEQAVAVLYPEELGASASPPAEALSAGAVRYAAYCHGKNGGEAARIPEEGWLQGGPEDLAGFLEDVAVPESRLSDLVKRFTNAVEAAAGLLGQRFEGVSAVVKQENCQQTDQMVAALILNALVFHHLVAANHPRQIDSPRKMRSQNRITADEITQIWEEIMDINYYPIFAVARDCLNEITDDGVAANLLEMLVDTANRIASVNAHTLHNLTGEAFGALISDRKFLASFYTLPSSATLLAELAVSRLDVDWSNTDEITSLRIADFACGTGALLSAVYKRIQARIHRCGIDSASVHQRMVEDVFVGTDIMPAAVHITAATLSSAHPSIDYTKSETHVMPFGYSEKDKDVKIGSLDLLGDDKVLTLFGDGTKAVTAQGEDSHSVLNAPHGSFDIVIMNPPYTSPTNHTIAERQKMALPSFAAFGMDNEAQKAMGRKVRRLVGNLEHSVRGDGNVGLPTDFFDLAHLKLKPGGTAAFVLSASMPTGRGWAKLRDLLASHYDDVYIISCGKNFSSDTSIAEVLVVATKRSRPRPENEREPYWKWINIRQQPRSGIEAQVIAGDINSHRSEKVSVRKVGDTVYGHISVCGREVSPAMIRSPEVAEALLELVNSRKPGLSVPRTNKFVPLPVVPLGTLGTRGPVHRDIARSDLEVDRGVFHLAPHPGGKVDFPILWGHNHLLETQLVLSPDHQGVVAEGCQDEAPAIWSTATRLHFTLDFGLASHRMVACLTSVPALGGRAWPSFMLHTEDEPGKEAEEWIYPVLLWANSTLGLMSFYVLGTRNQPARSSLTITRLPELPVLDPRQLTDNQLIKAANIFGEFKNQKFQQANMAAWDPVRKDLDRALLLDLLNCEQEALDRVDIIRSQWCREPHLVSKRSQKMIAEDQKL